MSEGTDSSLPAPRDPRIPERRFRDDEVSHILDRVASQEARPDMSVGQDVTLSDLMEAAAGAGLDPGEVRRAAALVPDDRGGTGSLVLGATDRREVSAYLEAAHIPTDRQTLVRLVEKAMGNRGKVLEDAPMRFLWKEHRMAGSTTLTLLEGDRGLEVRIATDRAGHYMGLWSVGLAVWALLSALTPLGALPLAGQFLAFLVTPIVVARPFWAAADRRLRSRLERVTLDVLRLADASGPAALPPGEDGGA